MRARSVNNMLNVIVTYLNNLLKSHRRIVTEIFLHTQIQCTKKEELSIPITTFTKEEGSKTIYSITILGLINALISSFSNPPIDRIKMVCKLKNGVLGIDRFECVDLKEFRKRQKAIHEYNRFLENSNIK